MKHLRVIFSDGNKRDYETEAVPRIGEQIVLTSTRDGGPAKDHFFRVRDVIYRLDNKPDHQAAVLVEEESDSSLAGVR